MWTIALLAGALAAVLMLGLYLPADVPDASSAPVANYIGSVDVGNSVAQTFVPLRDNLDGVSLLLSTEESEPTARLAFKLFDGGPDGQLLREVSLPVASLPEGDVFRYRPGGLEEKWTKISFEPVPGSAGRPVYFELDGQGIPTQNRVRTMLSFPSKYPRGIAFVNGISRNASVVFRAHSRGPAKGYLWALSSNLTAGRPGVLSSPAPYVALGAAYLALLAALLILGPRVLRR